MAVRREKVVLELEDQFTAGALRSAGAAEVLDKSLDSLGRRSVQTSRAQRDMEASVSSAGRAASASEKSIDRYSGRLGLLVDVAASLGPSLVPMAAVGIPAATGLASALGMVALGGGTAILAFQDVGDALDKVNKARIQPTTANLSAAHLALEKLGPDARELVAHLANLSDEAKQLRDAAAGGLLPGVEEALDSLITRAPQAEKILHRIGHAAGEMLAEGADSLASDRWDEFFDFIQREAPPAISQLGEAVGNLTHTAASLWIAFSPVNSDFLSWLVSATEQTDQWAEGLSKTQGFQEFVAYIRENGPQVGETLGAIAMALLHIVEAAAPIGAATLPILEAVAETVSAIADSDLGTPLLAFLALSRAVAIFDRGLQSGPIQSIRQLGPDLRTMAETNVVAWGRSADETERYNKAAERSRATLGKMASGIGIVGGLALAQSGLTDEIGLTNTAMFASMGLMAGPWGAAVGGAIGAVLDFKDGQKSAAVSAEDLLQTLDKQTGAITANTRESVKNALQKQGVYDAANALGLSLVDITDAALGSEAALARVKAATDALTVDPNSRVGRAAQIDLITGAIGGQNKELDETIRLSRQLAAADGTLTTARDFLFGSTADQTGAERDHRGAVDDTRGALEGLTAVTDTNKDGVIDNTDAILDNIAAMEDRTDAINAAFNAETNYQRSLQIGADREKAAADIRKQIADAEAQGAEDRAALQQRLAGAKTPAERRSIQAQIQDSLENQRETIQRLREQLEEYAPTLDKTTKAGQANRDVLSQMAAGWNNLSGEQQNAKGKYEEARRALIDQAKQFGASDKAAKGYADRLLEIPPRISTKILLEKQRAQEMLDAYSEAFNGLDGRVAKTMIQLRIDQMTGEGGKLDNGGKSSPPTTGGGKGGTSGPTRSIIPPRQRLTAADVTRGSHTITSHGASADDIAAAVSRHARPMFDNVSFNSDGDFDRALQLASSLANKGGA